MRAHQLKLDGPGARGRRISGPLLRDLLDALVDGIRQTVRLGVDGRSVAHGPPPAWLEEATAFDLVDVREGSTDLVIETRSLAQALPDKFRQVEMFAALNPDETCFEIMVGSLEDALMARTDSDRFDEHVINTFESFGRLFRYGIDVISFSDGKECRIDREAIEGFRRLRRNIPADQRVIVEGKLDVLRHSDRVFTILLDSGASVRGVVAKEAIDLSALASLWGKRARISGTAKFRPSGSVLRIEADQIEVATPGSDLFSRMPASMTTGLDVRALRQPQGPRSGIAAIFGQWPGDESEEEVLAAISELS